MADINLIDVRSIFRDVYAEPGTRLKQWVVDQGREIDWEHETCPRVEVAEHDDNTGLRCRNSREVVPWTYLNHDCCSTCCDLHDEQSKRDEIITWLGEKAKRPPVCADRTKLSDEIQPDYAMGDHPTFAMLRKP